MLQFFNSRPVGTDPENLQQQRRWSKVWSSFRAQWCASVFMALKCVQAWRSRITAAGVWAKENSPWRQVYLIRWAEIKAANYHVQIHSKKLSPNVKNDPYYPFISPLPLNKSINVTKQAIVATVTSDLIQSGWGKFNWHRIPVALGYLLPLLCISCSHPIGLTSTPDPEPAWPGCCPFSSPPGLFQWLVHAAL